MSWIFGSNEPSKEDIMLAMLDSQGKVITGLVAEVENLTALIQSYFNTETDTKDKSVEVKMPIPLHKRNVNDIDDVFHMELDEFTKGCHITEDSDDNTEDLEVSTD